VIDLSRAYPNAVSVLRGFALIDRRHVLIVDEIVPRVPLSSVDWQMHTAAGLELGYAMTTLIHPAQSAGAARPRLYIRIIESGLRNLSFRSAAPSEPQGQNRNIGVAKLVLHLEQVAQPLRLAVLLSPDAGTCATAELPLALRRPLTDWV
jgi:hypothetical protein